MNGNGGKTLNPGQQRLAWFWFLWQRLYSSILTPPAIVVGAVVVATFMVVLCSVVLYEARTDALARAEDASRNVALIAERDIERNFELFTLSLQAVVDGVNNPKVMATPAWLRREILFDRATTATFLGSTIVTDSKGDIVVDSVNDVPRKVNFADRPYFLFHKNNPDAGLYVSGPYPSRLKAGLRVMVLSRRIVRPDGAFGGVATISINLEYFHKLFSALELGPHGAVSLIRQGGTIIMRQPYDAQIIGHDVSHTSTYQTFISRPEGTFSGTSSIDGVRRLYYFKNFPNLPLILIVAEGENDIYAAWRRRAIIIGSMMAVFTVGCVGLSFVLAAQLRRRMRAESELVLLARTDGLTGLNNRRTLGEILDREWRRARRTRSMLSLLFVDVDRFKAYNDTYGHQAGDDALTAVARCIGENIRRPGDSAARYGGEEFVVVLPNTTEAGASAIAEKIRVAISGLAIEHAGSEFGRVTASIGAVSAIPDGDGDGDVATVIRAADGALYNAKATGRNKVASCSMVDA